MTTLTLIKVIILIGGILNFHQRHIVNAGDCNEYVCGSVVSKCLLKRSCECELSNCFCCKDCIRCLGRYYRECCGCLDMCPQQNATTNVVAPKSEIGDFEGVPEIFDSLTFDEEYHEWTVVRFQMRIGLNYAFLDEIDQIDTAFQQPISSNGINYGQNCTVIYVNNCMTNKKCAQYCESMGATSFRWFHDACCECVGQNCYNYGINDSRCSNCPEIDEDLMVSVVDNDDYANMEDEIWNYGEEMTFS